MVWIISSAHAVGIAVSWVPPINSPCVGCQMKEEKHHRELVLRRVLDWRQLKENGGEWGTIKRRFLFFLLFGSVVSGFVGEKKNKIKWILLADERVTSGDGDPWVRVSRPDGDEADARCVVCVFLLLSRKRRADEGRTGAVGNLFGSSGEHTTTQPPLSPRVRPHQAAMQRQGRMRFPPARREYLMLS